MSDPTTPAAAPTPTVAEIAERHVEEHSFVNMAKNFISRRNPNYRKQLDAKAAKATPKPVMDSELNRFFGRK